MRRRTERVKLSEQWQGGTFKCFKKYIGGRRFYLTHDRQESELGLTTRCQGSSTLPF